MTTVPTKRSPIIGSSTGPEAPYPLKMGGKVIRGFGRGSKDLGIPTANLPVDDIATPWIAGIESGVYFGWASLRLPPSCPDRGTTSSSDTTNITTTSIPTTTRSTTPAAPTTNQTTPAPDSHSHSHSGFTLYPMVMSIGYNTFFHNPTRSTEVHILHTFPPNKLQFYGAQMRLLIVGFIREERDYPSVQDLVEDIRVDCEVARRSLDREAWAVREVGGTLDGSWLVRETGEEE
ncbi:hypothetical protein MD484_g3695, partial [Candolleomyces efflorescens]